ncbi:Gfo/Idh/MocA family protein [Saccharothrix deserti]|uniref:Gfo/Idh/MocA family protein n=1 Tax=Saccharothrix deserti TaxID=2593674 RepID=UPI00131AF4CE|nr:Gfo/Idh/MocA family oxidoreductase [Saccharothrix deserti]
MQPVRVGVLGASSISWRRMLPAMRDNPGTTVVAVASRDKAKAERFAAEFGCAAVDGYAALLAMPDIEAVYLPLPNSLHFEWARAALESGKHVLSEKPLTTSAKDTAELARLADSRGLVLRENIAFVHHGQHRRVAELVDAGRIGALRHLVSSYCFPPLPPTDVRYRPELGGGALLDVGVYGVRAAQFFAGDDLTVVGAVLRHDPETGVDVSGSVLLRSGSGVMATANFGFEHNYGSRYVLWGSKATLSVDRAFMPAPSAAPVLRIEEQDHAEEITLPAEHQFSNSAGAFAAAVRTAQHVGHDPDHREWAGTAVRTGELIETIAETADRVTIAAGS